MTGWCISRARRTRRCGRGWRASNASLGAIGIAVCIVAIFSATFWQVLYAILG